MGIAIGRVTGQRVGNFKEWNNIRILEVDLLGDSANTILWVNVTGEDTAPVNGDMVVVLDMGSFRFAVATWDLIAAIASAGERRFYSRDSTGAEQATLNLKDDGQMELNGTGDFAVRFAALETALNVINTKFDAHTHPDPVSGNTGTPNNAPLGLDISGAKIDEIEVPS